MKKYLIERDIPGVDALGPDELRQAAATSNAALARLAPRVQWLQSFIAPGKTFCVYLAEDEADIHEHARLSGFPANRITPLGGMVDPATAEA